MKKILCALLCICMVFSLCACAGLDTIKNTELPPLPTPEPAAEETAAPAQTDEQTAAPAPSEKPHESVPAEQAFGAELGDRVVVYTKKTQEDFEVPDGTVILAFSYETPTVKIEERPEAAEEINEQLRLLDEIYISGSGNEGGKSHLLEEATDNYDYVMSTGTDLNTAFTSARTVSVMRADGSAVSFRYWTSVYAGGTRDRRSYVAYSFSTKTGEKLTLDCLSDDPESLKTYLAEELIALAKADEELYAQLQQGEGDMNVAIAALVREGNWYLSNEGMVFFPAFGELKPEEEGIPIFTIPYTSLAGVIDEQFLPAAREGDGTLGVVRLSEVEDGTVWSIDRLNISEGEDLYLTVEGTVYDVAVSRASYFDQGGEKNFYETERLWYASFMTDCALQLSVLVPGGMPDLMIRYTDSSGEESRLLLSESGVDGGLVLVDDTISAVG